MNRTDTRLHPTLRSSLAPFQRDFWAVAALSFVSNILMLAPTVYMLQVFDRVLPSQNELTLAVVSVWVLALYGCIAVTDRMRTHRLVHAGVRLDQSLGPSVFDASYHAHLGMSGGLAKRAFPDLLQIRQFLTGQGILALLDAPWSPLYIGVLFFLHPWLGLLGVAFALTQLALTWWGHRHTSAPSEAANMAHAETHQFLETSVRNAESITAMGMVPGMHQHWQLRHVNSLRCGLAAQRLTHRVSAYSKFIRYTQQSLTLAGGALLVMEGRLSPGAMIAANILMSRALAPIDLLASTWRQAVSARYALKRLSALLRDTDWPHTQTPHAVPTGALTLSQVCAHARGRKTPILQDINLQFSPGTLTVVVGPSGCGKSTLARVILGLWPYVDGEVRLDGHPIAGWCRTALGPHLGYLPQDVELLDGSIAQNIARMGEVDPEKVIAAAQATGLHETILRFAKGYDTPIGEAGLQLSGGQRQRIGLARAIYGNPKLIVLDEPNAHLDDAGEVALLATLAQIKARGTTVVLITHRPHVTLNADRVLTLRKGQVHSDTASPPAAVSVLPSTWTRFDAATQQDLPAQAGLAI